MRIHAAHLTGPPDGPVALQMPKVKGMNHGPGDLLFPHPDWVAAAQPCPTCHDTGKILRTWRADIGGVDCPDCIGGKVELTYPCPTCEGDTVDADPSWICPDCGHNMGMEFGRVSAGVGTITLVTIPPLGRHDPCDCKCYGGWPHDKVGTGWDSREQGQLLDIVPPPRVKPGDTVAIWTAEQETTPPIEREAVNAMDSLETALRLGNMDAVIKGVFIWSQRRDRIATGEEVWADQRFDPTIIAAAEEPT